MQSEASIEDQLITELTHGKSQWTFRPDLKNEDQLWDNFFKILSANNKDVLNDVPLTQNEKAEIRSKIIHPTFYKSAEWLVGANRQVRVQIQRDDTTLGIADLLVIDNTNISGGSSVYEVVHQIQYRKRTLMERDRRGDVTLLINGLPMIHIELKNQAHSPKEAFNQIQKYIDEQVFNDIYSTLQMFVISNGTHTQYIAASEQLREEFLTNWVDNDNRPVQNLFDFARDVLSIPAAHNMMADYVVLDNDQQNIILLRPYQIHAIEAIKRAAAGVDNAGVPQSGFIWHTTGSGKTLTSYKVAHNLLTIPSIQKTVFLIDRKDLDTQTTQAFQTYAENDSIDVEETSNSYELIGKLLSSDKRVIVTTRQKMQALFKRIREDKTQKAKYQRLRNVKLAFIVDECHRAVSPDQKNELDAFFAKKPLWYGFTGTPIFAENARQEKGQNARTTEQQYGPCLHKYTIKDAIRDHAVLGFQVDEEGNPDDEKLSPDALKARYLSTTHMRAVVKKFFDLAYRKLDIYNQSRRGYIYDSILTTSSIKQAQKYYRLFRKVITGQDPDIMVPERIKRIVPDFPKIAITYSVAENTDEAEGNQDEMKQSITDYNQLFGTNFSMDNIAGYNNDINNRLARKKSQFKPRSEQLDLVIVVDRLLTGFDAPVLSTLFIDRPPMPYKDLIQAFSRTNRIFDNNKRYGQIVTFQDPDQYKQDINDALTMYSNGGTDEVLAPTWDQSILRFKSAEKEISRYKGDNSIVDESTSEDEKRKFAHAYQEFDKAFAAVQTYQEFNDVDLAADYGLDENMVSELEANYEVVKEQLKQKPSGENPKDDFDPDYELESWAQQTINYAYILQLIQAYIPADQNDQAKRTDAEVKEIEDYIGKLKATEPEIGDLVEQLWQKVKADPQKYQDKQVNELLQEMIDQARETKLTDFANEYKLNLDDLRYVISNFDPDKPDREQVGLNNLLTDQAFAAYKAAHGDTKKLHWRGTVRRQVRQFYNDEMAGLMQKA